MKLVVAFLCCSTVTTAGTDLNGNARGLGTPFVDKTAQKFLDAWPKAAGAIGELDELVFPGGEVCDVRDSATAGHASAISTSPDGRTLVVITSVKLDKKMAKRLALKSHDPDDVQIVAIVIDGPSHALWTSELGDRTGCGRGDTTFTWRADGKSVLAVSGDSKVAIDLKAHTTADVKP